MGTQNLLSGLNGDLTQERATYMIFLGFSGAGPLSARWVSISPERVLAAVLSSPVHYEPLGIDTQLVAV